MPSGRKPVGRSIVSGKNRSAATRPAVATPDWVTRTAAIPSMAAANLVRLFIGWTLWKNACGRIYCIHSNVSIDRPSGCRPAEGGHMGAGHGRVGHGHAHDHGAHALAAGAASGARHRGRLWAAFALLAVLTVAQAVT